MNVKCDYCGALHWKDEQLSTSRPGNPVFGSCCLQGDIHLDPWTPLPPFLRELLTGSNQRARNFQDRLRHYNNAFAFTSIKCNQETHGRSGGVMDFQIYGGLYHLQGPLQSDGSGPPTFAQLYIYDPQAAPNTQVTADRRLQSYTDLDPTFVREFTQFLHHNNPYISMYNTAKERLEACIADVAQVELDPQMGMRLIVQDGADRRRENLPTVDEVAAVIPDEWDGVTRDGRVSSARSAILSFRGSSRRFTEIPVQHASYLPLAYPLLFPYGDNGFHQGRDWSRFARSGWSSGVASRASLEYWIASSRSATTPVL
ncbi:hypothetical protein B0H65DRAFT_501820 [Neurospora tetraspora]|uniref:Helitron helicase-like domain-containing protein n=1 Tax=Neurospora tetraspora TaxID=94610 RepID=A0AAE0J756_9PEZI|nr:hypothetical protein B0H65DRAFT_501820 [Neurospora tetraspora]